MVLLLGSLLVAGGLAVVVSGITTRRRDQRRLLESLLDAELAEPSRSPEALAELVRRAGALAERSLDRTTWAEGAGTTLTRAGWTLRPGEFLTAVAGLGLMVAVLGWMVTASPVWAGALAAVASTGSMLWVQRKGKARVRAIEEQLPQALQLLASSLDSGASVLHAMELTAEEGDPPLADELGRVVAETRVGRPLIDSLEAMATRLGSVDVTWTVEAIRIQHTTGGKLADTLRVLADFMRARVEVRGEVRALSAEARLSGKVLTLLPLAIAGYLLVFRRSYIEPLYTTSAGTAMLFVAAVGLVMGTLWMRRIVRKVEV